ncbi:PQQ-binding-like beta-propeller repeat protein [Pontiellaceae bacterium B12227]|nr:PQQ-binding-like beta-propeller repeat protein [Pontiellaceae bacterium B12227]
MNIPRIGKQKALIPLTLLCGVAIAQTGTTLPDAFNTNALQWVADLGSHQYTIPLIDNGRLFIGINDHGIEHPAVKASGGGILMCLDAITGTPEWQLPIPRYEEGDIAPSHYNRWKCGVCSRPAIDDRHLYIVGPRGDVLCIDRNGQADGNNGPFKNEAEYMEVPGYALQKSDGDIIWKYNFVEQNNVVPHDVCGSSPLLIGDYLYACTSNGQDNKHRYIVNPEAPALIALHKTTGRLAATEQEGISERTFHCNWSSPVEARINNKPVVLFGGGDGILYAFEALSVMPDNPAKLRKVWQYDCCPARYRLKDGQPAIYSKHSRRTPAGPSEIIAIPKVVGNRVYVAIGQSPNHGPGQGLLTCLDVSTGNKIWESAEVDRTTAMPAIHNGLLFISDYSGKLSCLDAETGQLHWQHDMESGSWHASPIVADGRVYISTEKRVLWILAAEKEKRVLNRSRVKSPTITPLVENGVFYLPTQKRLYALKAPWLNTPMENQR